MAVRATVWLLLAAQVFALASSLHAEFNFAYPRNRVFHDAGRWDMVQSERRRFGVSTPRYRDDEYSGPEVIDFTIPRAGANGTYSNGYQWRDFAVSTSSLNYAFDAYAGYQGFDIGIFTLFEPKGDYDHSGPLSTDYRAGYTHKIDNAAISAAYSFIDWNNSRNQLGKREQGFSPAPYRFNRTSQELYLASWWFNDLIQEEGVNYLLGLDSNIRLDYGGFRGQVVVGAFVNNPEVDVFTPNAARVMASLIYQNHYHTNRTSMPGSDFLVEASWDLRVRELPIVVTAALEYYYPWNDDTYRDRITWRASIGWMF